MSASVQREQAIFVSAVGQVPPEQWEAYARAACAGDEALLARVRQLLRAHAEAGSFLDDPAPDLPATAEEPAVTERPGTLVGPYKLLEQIGEGGFGVVFMAEQAQPLRRKVALKVLKPGMDTKQVVARFEAERQALALMDHPNIAHVFDGGATASGRPYFVMELVRGVPITAFCDQNQLGIRERLRLFVDVCQAVQHAHQKGIIHRDLKPGNVLVTLHDGRPVPKVIDFGVAKALGQELTDSTLFTGFAQLVGTPLYMSPEQAELSGLDVDTRSDIYSLGVLLYELVTGTTPFEKERFCRLGPDEMRRILREEEPPRPSTRLSTLGQAAAPISARRGSDPRRLRQLCRGEVDWVVMRCLDKDRARRYATANGLALDLERYLADEPVQACPPSAWYRARKFARRNKSALATAALLGALLAAALAAVGWAVRDRAARVKVAEGNVKLALEDATALRRQARWPEALEAAKRAEGFWADGGSEPLRRQVRELRKDLEMVLRLEDVRLPGAPRGPGVSEEAWRNACYARAFQDYGIDVDALETEDAAARVRARSVWLQLTAALDNWADDRKSSRTADPASWLRLVAVAKAADPDPWRNQVRDALAHDDCKALNQLAASANVRDLPLQSLYLLVYRGHLDLALERSLLRQAQREHPDDFWVNFQLAWGFGPSPQELDEKIRFYTAAVVARPKNAATRVFLGNALGKRGRWEEAIAEYRKAVELDPGYPWAHDRLARGLAACPDEKVRSPREAVEHGRKAAELAPDEPDVWCSLGMAWYRAGEYRAAVAALEQSERLRPGGDRLNRLYLAMADCQLGRSEKAHRWYDQAVRGVKNDAPPGEEFRRLRAEAAGLLGITEK
jgi:serine/threonine protein kinase/Tfp pilus assembly protein PilF